MQGIKNYFWVLDVDVNKIFSIEDFVASEVVLLADGLVRREQDKFIKLEGCHVEHSPIGVVQQLPRLESVEEIFKNESGPHASVEKEEEFFIVLFSSVKEFLVAKLDDV